MPPRINTVPRRTDNGRPKYVQALYGLLAVLAALPAIPYYSLQYLTRLRDPTVLGYKHFMFPRIVKLFQNIMPMPTPETPVNQATPWKAVMPSGNLFSKVKMNSYTIPPASANYLGHLAELPPNGEVGQVEQYGFVFSPKDAPPGNQKAAPKEKIILYFHGGGYSTGHPTWTLLPGKIARDTGLRVWAGQYRKCLDVTSAWPAPLVDALAHWDYLVNTLGFAPSSIVLMGDSAGGHLCLSLTQQLMALQSPLPGGLALSSPWSDLTFSQPSWEWKDDYLGLGRLKQSIDSLSRFFDLDALAEPIFSPAFAPQGYWKPLTDVAAFISLGTKESLHDEVQLLIKGMRRDGVSVDTFEDQNQLHCAPLLAGAITPEASYTGFYEGVQGVVDQVEASNP